MRKNYIYQVILLILLIRVSPVSAQEQDAISKNISERFLNYCTSYPREEIYMHTDREQYIAGEDFWFKVYSINRATGARSNLSSIAYIEILNAESRPIVRKRILLTDGSGPGHIVLPDSLRTGTYILRAYTNWMKNFLPGNTFVKEIGIFNALEDGGGLKKSVPVKTVNTADNKDAVIHIDKSDNDNIRISVSTSPAYIQKNGSICRLFVNTCGTVNYSGIFMLDGVQTSRSFPRSKFSSGINHITLFDSKGNPVDEKFIFTPEGEKDKPEIKISPSYKYREKISFDIAAENKDLEDLSISVSPAGKRFLSMEDYMLFGSEFGYELINKLAQGYQGNLSEELIDSLLALGKSNWIDWKKILGNTAPEIKYQPEKRYHYLTGTLISSTPGDNVSGKFILMSIPGKEAGFQYAITDDKGNFDFVLPVDQQEKHIVIQPDVVNDNQSIKIQSSFSEEYATFLSYGDSLSPIPSYITKQGINYQVNKIYGVPDFLPGILSMPAEKILRFYGKPDISLVMDNYIKLPVMEEVFFELLPGTFLKKKKSVYDITVLDPVTNDMYREPQLFIDGVRIDNANLIASLDPEIVEKIDVVRSRYMVGDYLFRGIVNVITRAGDFSAVNLPDHAVSTFYRVIDPVETFSMPGYSDARVRNSRIPDFRNTLYWNAQVNKDSVEFWSSDYSSDYRILIEGFAADGRFISIEKTIVIK
ncbi:MAG: hypothetical protein ACM3NR_00220 [Methanosarcina sp.]